MRISKHLLHIAAGTVCGIAALLSSGSLTAQAAGEYRFSERSVLSSGRWVKVEVTDAGVYELSYAQLRDMGLNPGNVSVYGEGGKATSYSLVVNGQNNVHDDLQQVPVHHAGDKIYFYARGLENPVMGNSGYEFDERNTFNRAGHYFLTDTNSSLTMEKAGSARALKAGAKDCSSGFDYRINNEDHLQGRDRAGLFYWDYAMAVGDKRNWNVPVDYLEAGRALTVEAKALLFSSGNPASASISLEVDGSSEQFTYSQQFPGTEAVNLVKSTVKNVTNTAGTVRVGVTLDASENELYFDRWMMNYPKRISASATNLVQQRLGVPMTVTDNGYIQVGKGWLVMDVTDPGHPVLLDTDGGKAYFPASHRGHDLVVFNPSRMQKVPSGAVAVENQNLHGAEDCSLLIITVPEYLEYAEEIAALHRRHDGINVLVTTAEKVYNEFTSGNRHPMAYRMLVKMLSGRTGEPLKNVLFLGPIRSDARNINDYPNMHRHFLIGMQEGCATTDRVAALTMGFYGSTNDNVDPAQQKKETMQVGVGLLPVKDAEDARMAVDKIRRYLEELRQDGMAWLVNETMQLSCTGDSHMHDNQSLNFLSTLKSAMGKVGAGTPRNASLMPDFFNTYDAIADVAVRNLNQGKLLSLYIGHAASDNVGFYLYTGNLVGLKNRVPCFMLFAGCDLMLPDHGASGIVIESVLHAPRGLVGAIGTTRMAWANQNAALANAMARYMFSDRNGDNRTVSPTMGEVYACAMSGKDVEDTNKLVYEYIGDPALVIPMPLTGIDCTLGGNLISYRGGDMIVLNGRIENSTDETPFNGTAVVKLCEPNQKRTQLKDPTYAVTVSDALISSVTVKVRDGVFTAKVPVPADCDRLLPKAGVKKSLNIYVSAYDPSRRLAASGYVTARLAASDENRTEKPGADEMDNQAPTVRMDFDQDTDMLTVTATDNVGMLPGVGDGAGLTMKIDGNAVKVAPDVVGTGGVDEYRTSIYVGGYAPGQHTVTYSSIDMKGNYTPERKYGFTVPEDVPEMGLTVLKGYGIDNVTFQVDAKGKRGLELVVFDSDGRNVFRTDDVDGTVEWGCSLAKAGVYRAAVRATDGRKCRSEWVTFSVID